HYDHGHPLIVAPGILFATYFSGPGEEFINVSNNSATLTTTVDGQDSGGSQSYTVTSLADTSNGACASDCTLRDAITAANSTPGATITFSVSGTINLQGALPAITAPVVIQGPGAQQLTVRRDTGGDYRIFTVSVAAPGVVSISGLTFSNGAVSSGIGGGVANLGPGTFPNTAGTLNLSDCVISGNSALSG